MNEKPWIFGWGGMLALLGTVAIAAAPLKDPLYGDPGHPNISGMWNPEFAYFGPPVGDAPARPPGPPAGAPPGGAAGGAAPRAGGGGLPGGGVFPGASSVPQLKPPYAQRYAEWQKKFDTDGSQEPDTVTRCLAFGIARFGTMPMEIIQTPGQITMNLGVLHDIRRIYMDGIGHTVGADPSFSGDSVGRWEGDTLIVETNNVRPGQVDRNGVPYSDKLTAVEKIRRVSPTRLEIETTLTDPEAFMAPFTIKRAYVPMPTGSRFEEYICENNKDI
ncbi:MAG: hypothetical protein ABI645_02515 [Pseudomonadota bacterium]